MYAPGGFDSRKNCDRLIKAYALLAEDTRDKHQLVIVSRIPEGDAHNLRSIAQKAGLKEHELIITGYVSDDNLVA